MSKYFSPLLGSKEKLPYYVISASIEQGHLIRNKGFPNYQLIYCTCGNGIIRLNNKVYSVCNGDGVYLPPDYPHELYSQNSMWEVHCIEFNGIEAENMMSLLKLSPSKLYHMNDVDSLDIYFRKIIELITNNCYDSEFQCSAYLYQIFAEINRILNIQNGRSENTRLNVIKPDIDYIDKNYKENITLELLADISGMSPQYVCRIFKELLNVRPFEFLSRKRIQQAKLLLLEDKLTINEISEETGYKDCSYFCSVFKKYEKISPAEFRNLYKKY